jgi:hypothetical protein
MKKHTIFCLALTALLAFFALGGCSADGGSFTNGVLTISGIPASVKGLTVSVVGAPITTIDQLGSAITNPIASGIRGPLLYGNTVTLREGLAPLNIANDRFAESDDFYIAISSVSPPFSKYTDDAVTFTNGCASISWDELKEFGEGGTLKINNIPTTIKNFSIILTTDTITSENWDTIITNITENTEAGGLGSVAAEETTAEIKLYAKSNFLGFTQTGSYTIIVMGLGDTVKPLYKNLESFTSGSAEISWNNLIDSTDYQYILNDKICANINELSTFLDSAPINTVSTPYKIKIAAGTLSTLAKDGDWLGEVLALLDDHYISLDLSSVTGNAITGITPSRTANDKIKSITLSAGITSIGANAFDNLTGLTSLTVNAVNPPTLAGSLGSNLSGSLIIYVPSASVAEYSAADYWKNYSITGKLN